MADNDKSFDGRGGWGSGSDTDRKLGSFEESREYARRFDPRAEHEFTNRMEVPNQIEQARLLKDLEEHEQAAREGDIGAQQDVHFFPSVGKFIIPQENTWAGHLELVADNRSNLFFNPEKYVYFDKIIAQKFKNPALFDETHRDYAKLEGLRTNLEVLRNDIIGMYLDDGAFNPGDEKYIPLIAGIATEIGNSLAHDKWYKRPFTRSFSVDVANVEGVGAREIYKHLLSIQQKPGVLGTLKHAITTTLGMPNRNWELPPLEKTPYSDYGLSAAPPLHAGPGCPPALSQTPGMEIGERMADLSTHSLTVSHKLRSIDTLTPPTRETSVEEARKILRWLKNLQFGDRDMEEWMATGTPAEQLSKAEAITRLVEIFEGEAYKGIARSPSLKNEPAIHDGAEAAGALSQGLLEHGMAILPVNHARLPGMDALLAGVPDAWEMRQTQSATRLLETLESGIERASGKSVGDFSPAARLLEKSENVYVNARQLRGLETLEEPRREESVELAREILRKLKNLKFSDKPLKEMIDTGRPEDKAELAQKIDEAVDAYKNLVAEAAQANPEILQNEQVKAASEAAGTFSHALKLMAAKEIPSSVAAAQQISADVTQMPEEWKGLNDRTVGRLVTSMEGGLERAVAEIAMDQQEQQQDQDQQQQAAAAEAAASHSEHSRRKKRRRRKSSGNNSMTSSKGASKRRGSQDINGDGVLDKFQGINQGSMKLNDKDLAAVRALGGNLRTIGDQAANLPPPVIDVSGMQQLTPDDKTFLAREQDQKKNPGSKRPKDLGI